METSNSTFKATSTVLNACTPSAAVIPSSVGMERRSALVDTKKLDALCTELPPLPYGNAWYWIKTEDFIDLLEKFADPKYNGVRVYMACYPEFHLYIPVKRAKQLVLIFVPTQRIDGKERKDDVSNIWTVDEDKKPTKLTESTARTWIENYRESVLPHLNSEGTTETGDTPFEETVSIWYEKNIIFGDGTPNGDPGLVNYIKCVKNPRMLTNYVTAVKVHFAAFLEGEGANFRRHRLTVIFQLHQKEDGPFDEKFVPGNKLFFGSKPANVSIPTDTGVPCPPSGHCDGSFIDD